MRRVGGFDVMPGIEGGMAWGRGRRGFDVIVRMGVLVSVPSLKVRAGQALQLRAQRDRVAGARGEVRVASAL